MKLRNDVDEVAIFAIQPWVKESKLSLKHTDGKKNPMLLIVVGHEVCRKGMELRLYQKGQLSRVGHFYFRSWSVVTVGETQISDDEQGKGWQHSTA